MMSPPAETWKHTAGDIWLREERMVVRRLTDRIWYFVTRANGVSPSSSNSKESLLTHLHNC